MAFRKLLFWAHLVAGCVAGIIVLVMSVTGLLLTYEKQMLARAERGPFRVTPAAGAARLPVDVLLGGIDKLPRNASLVLRSDPTEPAELSVGREAAMYVNPYDGRMLGRANPGTRQVFRNITAWHRWLGQEGEGRSAAKAITGACNLAFLFLVASGMYLWLPKVWSSQHLRPIAWFKGGLAGKARDFNWHNVFGIWAAFPLLIVVASAVPMSYAWGTDVIYYLTGTEAPKVAGRPGERGPRGGEAAAEPLPALTALWARAEQQDPEWKSITMRLPERKMREAVFVIDAGTAGQPQKRGTLTLDAATGTVKKWETFADNNAGRQWRMWSRFAHTGEYYGVVGQTIAGFGCLAGTMLVWTGIALSLRRLSAWRSRRRRGVAEMVA